MKKHTGVYKFMVTAALLLAASTGIFAAGEPEVEKKKVYSKSYPLDGNDKVSINNQFGEVKISTWNKSEVRIDITIIAKASTDERAQQILDLISIEDSKSADGVYFKTSMKSQNWKGDKKGSNNGMEINYEIQMPAGNPLSLKNSFGSSFVYQFSNEIGIKLCECCFWCRLISLGCSTRSSQHPFRRHHLPSPPFCPPFHLHQYTPDHHQ